MASRGDLWSDPDDEQEPAVGVLLDEGRGSLPFLLLHGEPLIACAAWGLGASGVHLVDTGTPWSDVAEVGTELVLHDVACPLTPPTFIAACVAEARAHGEVVVGVRPVTDTVRTLAGTPGMTEHPELGGLLDRDRLVAVASPLVLPPSVVAELDGWPGADLVEVLGGLARRHVVRRLEAPPLAARVADADDVAVLQAASRARG